METRIYVANLAKYNAGELVGEWITLPIYEDELQDRINAILGDDEECAIHDYEACFKIGEYDNITRINEIAQILEESSEDDSIIEAILDNYAEVDEGLSVLESGDFRVWDQCNSMSDIAYAIIEECGELNSMPEHLRYYFDYDAYGRDLAIEGTFLDTGAGSYVEVYR